MKKSMLVICSILCVLLVISQKSFANDGEYLNAQDQNINNTTVISQNFNDDQVDENDDTMIEEGETDVIQQPLPEDEQETIIEEDVDE